MDIYCERCGMDFKTKKTLIRHLEKEVECANLFSDVTRKELIDNMRKKTGITCEKCNKIYKNSETVRRHKCCKDPSNIKLEDLQRQVLQLQEDILNIRNTTQISNTLIDKSITNNITVNINSLKSPSVQQIQYLLNGEDTTELFMNCLKSIDGIKKYINTKYYDPNHPENQMIRKSDNHNELELYEDKWKKYNNMDASDLILINIGNDLTHYLDSLLENDEEQYEKIKQNVSSLNKMLMIHFNIDLTDDDNDSSEEWGRSGHPKLINGSYVWIDDKDVEYEKVKQNKEKIQNMLIKHIHQK